MKITINMPEDILQKADIRAKQLGLSRSSFLTMTVSEKCMQNDVIDMMPQLLDAMKKLEVNASENSEK